MTRNTKVEFTKKRKPFIVLICEGRNKTETNYFRHFIKRENPYNLKIFSSEDACPSRMAKKARLLIDEMQLDNKIGDKVFCLVDLDLSSKQYQKIMEEKTNCKKKCKIEFILSNPCFEAWLLYYFERYPKIEKTSQKVKERLKKHVPQYTENFDIVQECKLQDKHAVAINNYEKRSQLFSDEQSVLDKNPYTDIPDLLCLLMDNKR